MCADKPIGTPERNKQQTYNHTSKKKRIAGVGYVNTLTSDDPTSAAFISLRNRHFCCMYCLQHILWSMMYKVCYELGTHW